MTLDLTASLDQFDNASTTGVSTAAIAQIHATVFQFDGVTGIEYLVDGERWCGWENPCDG